MFISVCASTHVHRYVFMHTHAWCVVSMPLNIKGWYKRMFVIMWVPVIFLLSPSGQDNESYLYRVESAKVLNVEKYWVKADEVFLQYLSLLKNWGLGKNKWCLTIKCPGLHVPWQVCYGERVMSVQSTFTFTVM